jgi:hypothetical protein
MFANPGSGSPYGMSGRPTHQGARRAVDLYGSVIRSGDRADDSISATQHSFYRDQTCPCSLRNVRVARTTSSTTETKKSRCTGSRLVLRWCVVIAGITWAITEMLAVRSVEISSLSIARCERRLRASYRDRPQRARGGRDRRVNDHPVRHQQQVPHFHRAGRADAEAMTAGPDFDTPEQVADAILGLIRNGEPRADLVPLAYGGTR